MSAAVDRIEAVRRRHLEETVRQWSGLERLLVVELVRSLDEIAFAFHVAPNGADLLQTDAVRNLMMLGASTALATALPRIAGDPGGVPWGRSDPFLTDLVDSHLLECGKLSVVHRMASLERYGLAKTEFVTSDKLVIEVDDDGSEASERTDAIWLGEQPRLRLLQLEERLAAKKDEMGERIGRYVRADRGWFIAYNPDKETFNYHRDLAEVYSSGTAELYTLPPTSMIGGRTFGDWNNVSIEAFGRVLHHIACATKLRSLHSQFDLRNLLTVFARKDDIQAVWGGGAEGQRIMEMLKLDAEGAQRLEAHYEVPIPYYIDFGRDFVLLPIFGAMMNPVAGLTAQLRHHYRREWDRALDAREEMFRADLAAVFGQFRRYLVSDRSFDLYKSDGANLTDVDAAIVDRKSGELCLVQLKWPDIYGRSLTERQSRRTNLAKANEWVKRVHDWVDSRTSAQVCKVLQISHGGDRPVSLMVLSRHVADFVDPHEFDPRAIWISWPRLTRLVSNSGGHDLLETLARRNRGHRSAFRNDTVVNPYHFAGLDVEVRVNRFQQVAPT